MSDSPPDLDRRAEQLRKLTEVSRALTYATSLDAVFRLAIDRAIELLEADRAVLMLEDDDGNMRIRAAHGVDDALVSRFREPLDEGLIRRLQGIFGEIRPECFLGVPLVARGEVTGMLAVVRNDGDPCSDADEWLLSALADQAAVALENARLAGDVRRELEERLELMKGASASKERALATLAHELRTPLSAIQSYTQLLEMEVLGPVSDRQREALGRIAMSGHHLLAVLENVLDMARLDAGVLRVETARVEVGRVLDEARQLVLPDATAKEQSLTIDTGTEMRVHADAGRLRQVITNLLGNAVKYTPKGGSISVTTGVTERDGAQWCTIAIADSGPGIAADMLEHIFEPYCRAPATDGEAGAGLGLTIADELVRQMNGSIAVQSVTGEGTTFTVLLRCWHDGAR